MLKRLSSKRSLLFWVKALLTVTVLMSVTACGSLGGGSKEKPTAAPSETVLATQQLEASPTAHVLAGTPVLASTGASTPEAAQQTSTQSVSTPASLQPNPGNSVSVVATPHAANGIPTVVTAQRSGATPSGVASSTPAGVSTPVSGSTPGVAGTPANAASPVAALTVTSCEPDAVPQFTGNNPDFVVKEDLNFRSGPGADCVTIADMLSPGVQLTVVSDPVVREGETTRWVQVNVDGQIGWVALEYIEPVKQ